MVELGAGIQISSDTPIQVKKEEDSIKSVGTGGFLNPEEIISQFGLTSDMNVADFGSGAGYFTILIAQSLANTGKVTALDIMENALEMVRTKAHSLGLRNIQTVRGNLEVAGASGLSDNSQDLVLMANIFFQSDKKQDLMNEADRVLKPGGRLIIIDWQKSDTFGPPENLRVSKELIMSLASKLGLKLDKEINAGEFHFGLIFNKQ